MMCSAIYLCGWFQVTGIQGKREQKAGMGACKNHCYLSDSLPVKVTHTQLCKPSHKYSIVVKFFLSHNKYQPPQNSILMTDAICDLFFVIVCQCWRNVLAKFFFSEWYIFIAVNSYFIVAIALLGLIKYGQ